mgnify:CR=1 FL=1
MELEQVEISVTLPRTLWEELGQQAKTEHEQEVSLLIRAIEQFLGHQTTRTNRFKNGVAMPNRTSGKTRAMGKYAHVAGSTAQFMSQKQNDIQNER